MSFWTDLLGVPFRMSYVDAGGVRTRVLRAGTGTGPPVIFLNGANGHLEAFIPVVPAFAQVSDVHVIDMIGHGFTDPLTEPMSMDVLSKHALDYMDAAGLHSAHFVGLSMGAWTACWIAAHHPERVLSLILFSAGGDPNSAPAKDPKVGERLREMTKATMQNRDPVATRKRLEFVVSKPSVITDEMVDVRVAIYDQPRYRASMEYLNALTRPEVIQANALHPALLEKITAEALIVWGNHDPIVGGPEFLCNHIAKNKLIEFAITTHWVPFERPAEIGRIGAQFITAGLRAVEARTYE